MLNIAVQPYYDTYCETIQPMRQVQFSSLSCMRWVSVRFRFSPYRMNGLWDVCVHFCVPECTSAHYVYY
uniref:Uncharacterized protein n=1 Tax=Anguilla anguilla TaxID=7936 RepID=A0A0E9UKW9_ANGAN